MVRGRTRARERTAANGSACLCVCTEAAIDLLAHHTNDWRASFTVEKADCFSILAESDVVAINPELRTG